MKFDEVKFWEQPRAYCQKIRKEDDGQFYTMDSYHYQMPSNLFPIEDWDSPEAYKFANIRGYDPMLAKEIVGEDVQDSYFADSSNIIEEKFDGTRAIVQFFKQVTTNNDEVGYCRIFSRRISEKTKFFVENTDLLPQIRDMNIPELAGTVIDGELFINGRPFKDVSSTLNCKWNKSVERQLHLGFVSLHTFDILKYKGVDVRKMPLEKRKEYLNKVISILKDYGYLFIEKVPFYRCGEYITNEKGDKVQAEFILCKRINEAGDREVYLKKLWKEKTSYPSIFKVFVDAKNDGNGYLTPRAFYELIVSTGGEGVIVKPLSGKYKCGKRQNEYLKVKKFLTREVIIMGFTEPTKEYEGKFTNNRWEYWVDIDDKRLSVETYSRLPADELLRRGFIPVTRFYYYHLVGNIRYGVIICNDEIAKLPKNKKFNIEEMFIDYKSVKVIEVGDCGGFDDEYKKYFSFTRIKSDGEEIQIAPWEEENNRELVNHSKKKDFRGTVIEVKANELFKDTGKMRHPRFLRIRVDKSPLLCTWKDHIS